MTPHQVVQLEDVSTNVRSQQSDTPYQDHQEEFLDVSEMQLRIITGKTCLIKFIYDKVPSSN